MNYLLSIEVRNDNVKMLDQLGKTSMAMEFELDMALSEHLFMNN